MADKSLSNLTDAGAAKSGDLGYAVRDGNSRRVTFGGAAGVDTGAFLSDTGFALSDTGFALSDTGFALSDTGKYVPFTKVASQAQMEAASSTGVFVSPGRQHFHPGHPKCWAHVNVNTGTPSLTESYNISSITDTSNGVLTVTVDTDFSSATWGVVASVINPAIGAGSAQVVIVAVASMAAGAVVLEHTDPPIDNTTANATDPSAWLLAGFGDQA